MPGLQRHPLIAYSFSVANGRLSTPRLSGDIDLKGRVAGRYVNDGVRSFLDGQFSPEVAQGGLARRHWLQRSLDRHLRDDELSQFTAAPLNSVLRCISRQLALRDILRRHTTSVVNGA